MKKIILILLFTISLIYGNIIVGAERLEEYIPLLKNKRVAVVVNQSSLINQEHLVDVLSKNGINIVKIFAPEHGFRGDSDAGERIKNSIDRKTKLPIISLYGKHKKPTKKDLKDIDIVIFDIQDVGVRFYTYLSTLHYVMETVAQYNKSIIVLDRPNPNGARVDGEVLNYKFKSFVGMHPVPILYGMTIGEYAKMINGEGWLKGNLKAKLKVIPLKNYTHDSFYSLPIKPSPNLPNELSIYLYPSLALFEGTVYSVGRGTNMQFQVYGNPKYPIKKFSFIPISMKGAKYPKYENRVCYGVDLRSTPIDLYSGINLSYIIDAYQKYPDKKHFFLKNHFFDKLAGSDRLRKQIKSNMSEAEIKKSWQRGLEKFKKIREKYLIYK